MRSQTSMCIRIRRATRYVPPAIHAAAPGTSAGAPRRARRWRPVSSALRLLVPSLKPNRLRGVACVVRRRRRPPEAELRPPHRDHRRTRCRTRLRIACTATCGSLAHAWMQRSPPDRAGSRSSPRNAGRSASAGGRCAPQAEPVVEERRPEAERERERRRRQPSASPVSGGGASGLPPTAPPGAASAPTVIRSAARVQLCSRSTSAARSLVDTSSATKCSRSWAGVMIPAWCGPRKGIGASRLAGAVAAGSLGRRRGRRARRIPAAEPDRDTRGRRAPRRRRGARGGSCRSRAGSRSPPGPSARSRRRRSLGAGLDHAGHLGDRLRQGVELHRQRS